MRRVRTTAEIEAVHRLTHCASESAAAWPADRPVQYSTVYGTPETPKDCHLPEYILLRSKDPLIDLSLAAHGRSRTVLRRLHGRAGDGLRAVLAGKGCLFVGDYHGERFPLRERGDARNLLWDIIERGSPSELRAVCANPDIRSGFYRALIQAWRPDKTDGRVDEHRFREIVGFLSDNPRSSQSREESRERHLT